MCILLMNHNKACIILYNDIGKMHLLQWGIVLYMLAAFRCKALLFIAAGSI